MLLTVFLYNTFSAYLVSSLIFFKRAPTWKADLCKRIKQTPIYPNVFIWLTYIDKYFDKIVASTVVKCIWQYDIDLHVLKHAYYILGTLMPP
jgi:hypothetical protein